jgi:hypothetical protein
MECGWACDLTTGEWAAGCAARYPLNQIFANMTYCPNCGGRIYRLIREDRRGMFKYGLGEKVRCRGLNFHGYIVGQLEMDDGSKSYLVTRGIEHMRVPEYAIDGM